MAVQLHSARKKRKKTMSVKKNYFYQKKSQSFALAFKYIY